MSQPLSFRCLQLWRTLPIFGCLLLSAASACAQNQFVWLEGEAPTSSTLPPKVESTGRAELISEGKWLLIGLDAAKAEQVANDGLLVSYKFDLTEAKTQAIWNRIGFEASRSAFDWRVDGGNWTRVEPDVPVLDLTELQTWGDIGWLKIGEMPLGAGAHTLDIRLPKTKDDKDKTRPISYASDAILVTSNEFTPNGKWKPDQTGRDARDEEAAKTVYNLSATQNGERSTVKLKGLWEVARYDDNAPGEVAAPIEGFPSKPNWKAISVPGDKNKLRPDLIFAHRLWYRTKVAIPANQIGRSFYLHFPLNSLNTTVYINGVYCGFNKNPFVGFNVDVTKGVKAGVNEVWVGIKDAYYGFAADPTRPQKLRSMFHYPLEWKGKGFKELDYPIWNAFQSGILNTPELVASGPVYASDVFVKPSVAKKSLEAEVTLQNSSNVTMSGEVAWQAVDVKTGTVEKTFATQPFTVGAGAQKGVTLSESWANPKLWWPDQPNQYFLRTTLRVNGQPLDVSDTKFGFREWRSEGTKFTLNGVIWHMWAEISMNGATKEAWVADFKKKNMRSARIVTAGQASSDAHFWFGLETPEALDYLDENGIVVRRNTSPLDGETIGYAFNENDPVKRAAQGGSELKLDLMRNWLDTCVAQVKAERNHPSIQIWSIENEFAYINLLNLIGRTPKMDEYEKYIAKTSDAVMAVDPTRTVMIDGGGALKDQSLPVHGDHYLFSGAENPAAYPQLAYEANTKGGGRNRWEWDMKRPRFIGEDFFGTGINPADYAWVGGETTFGGKAQARDAVDAVALMLQQGYRWGGYYAAWHFWIGSDTGPNHYLYNAPRAILVRQWDWSFASGQKVTRTFGIFNDTQYSEPLTFTRALVSGGKTVWTKTTTHSVAPGTNLKWDEEIVLPTVTTRQEARLVLTLTAGKDKLFEDTKNVSILPLPKLAITSVKSQTTPKAVTTPRKTVIAKLLAETRALSQIKPSPNTLTAKDVALYDPKGTTASFFKRAAVPFTSINSLAQIPETARIMVVGTGALEVTDSTSSQFAAFAASGKRVIVLDQQNPLKFQALPAEMESTTTAGQFAYGEDLNHPVLRGLQQKDFVEWQTGKPVFYNAYAKPTRGAKSLVQAGVRLQNSPLVEIPVGTGLMLLCQFNVGANLESSPVAGQLVINLLNYANTYKLEFRPVAAVAEHGSPLTKVLDVSGLQYQIITDPIAAITDAKIKLAIISATPANLQKLATQPAKVAAFNKGGGYIVFHGLTPEGLTAYNQIVGFDHMIRPMRRERVSLVTPRSPLVSGLSLGDVVMLSGERINTHTADEYVASDIFSYVVDFDDVATFGSFTNDFYTNMVNGMTNADSWRYIVNVPKAENNYKLTLPKPQTITEFTWISNFNYNTTTNAALRFDSKDEVSFPIAETVDPQTFAVTPPRTGKVIDIINAEFTDIPEEKGLIGVDNVFLKAQRPADFYNRVKPILNIGGLMHYPRGEGGLVLCNLLLKDNEAVPVNAAKKRSILTAILRNLKAPFASEKTVIAGSSLDYAPIDLSKQANQYRNERGWFGDEKFTFAALPTGAQTFAGVKYNVFDFPTSPVPTAVMLGGKGVPNNVTTDAVRGIAVNRKADALFFLQAARIDKRRSARDLKDGKKLELARYVVTYSDGQKATISIYSEIDIEDFKQKTPLAISGAQIAWTRPYPNSEFSAVAYGKQWNNPRPAVEIASIDLEAGADRVGVPVLLALTAATTRLP